MRVPRTRLTHAGQRRPVWGSAGGAAHRRVRDAGRRAVRRTVRRAVRRAALPALALAGAAVLAACATTVVAGRGSPAPLVLPDPVDTGDGSPTPTSAATTASPPAGGPPSHVTFDAVAFDIPLGWTAANQSASLCVRAPDTAAGACALLVVDVPKAQAAHQVAGAPDPKASQGWWFRNGPAMCSASPPVPVVGSQLTGSGFVKMRNKTAAYSTWQVHCADPSVSLSPRLWWLPRTQVAFLQARGGGLNAQVDQIVASVTVS